MKKKSEKNGPRPEVADPEEAQEFTPETAEAADHTPAEEDAEGGRAESQLKRAMADLQNIRKRHAKEMDEARKRALEGLATELLPVLDNFHLALVARDQDQAPEEHRDSMVEGLTMVRSLLEGVLERHGLSEIPSLGEVFDPNLHEAVGVDEETTVESGRVSRVMQRGYTMSGRVIRPAKVFVASPPSAAQEPGAPEND